MQREAASHEVEQVKLEHRLLMSEVQLQNLVPLHSTCNLKGCMCLQGRCLLWSQVQKLISNAKADLKCKS